MLTILQCFFEISTCYYAKQPFNKVELVAIKLGLELKFGAEGLKIYPEIKKLEDPDLLEAISEGIKAAENIEELRKIYQH